MLYIYPVVDQIMTPPPKRSTSSCPKPVFYIMWSKGFCECDKIKDIGKGILPWIIDAGLTLPQGFLYNEAGGSGSESELRVRKQKSESREPSNASSL